MQQQPPPAPGGYTPEQAAKVDAAIERNWTADAAERSQTAQALLADWRNGKVGPDIVSPEYLNRLLDGPLTTPARQEVAKALADLRAYNASGDALDSDFYNGAMDPLPKGPR